MRPSCAAAASAAPSTVARERIWNGLATSSAGQRRAELGARGDVELREHLAQVVGDGVLADEQPLADRGVREAVAGQPRDLGLLGGELVTGLDAAPPDALARSQQFALRTRPERLGAHAREHLER